MAQTNGQNTSLSQLIAQSVDRLVESRIQKATYDRTYAGIISEILFDPTTDIKDKNWGLYKIRFNSTEKQYRFLDGIVHQVGERVSVTVCNNDINRLVVEPTVKSTMPAKIKWDKNNGGDADKSKMTVTRQVTTNGKTYETVREYIVDYKNKGQENEEPVKITLPNGNEIELEGFIDE